MRSILLAKEGEFWERFKKPSTDPQADDMPPGTSKESQPTKGFLELTRSKWAPPFDNLPVSNTEKNEDNESKRSAAGLSSSCDYLLQVLHIPPDVYGYMCSEVEIDGEAFFKLAYDPCILCADVDSDDEISDTIGEGRVCAHHQNKSSEPLSSTSQMGPQLHLNGKTTHHS